MPDIEQDLQGKRVAITGAGRGLGRALAIVAADNGAELVLMGRDREKLQGVAETIKTRSDRNALVVPCDLSNPDSITHACRSTFADNPTIDVLINNGAPWLTGSLDEIVDEDIIATVAAAVTGTILVTKGLLPGLRASPAADIVTVVSTSGLPGWDLNDGSAPFYAAKHGQSGFSDKLRHELKGTNIRVSAIYPPDFDDADPADDSWENAPAKTATLSNRELVATVLYIIAAPRACSFPVVIMAGPSTVNPHKQNTND